MNTVTYDIVVNIIRKGDTDVPLRFMAQNPFSLLASNIMMLMVMKRYLKLALAKKLILP